MKSINKKLALATCTLLGNGLVLAEGGEDWAWDTSYLHYEEEDRITVDKLISNLVTNVSEEDKVKVNLVFDTMSGATPSGAVIAAGSFATVSTPSGAGGFSAGSGSTAVAEFNDTRLGVSLDWEHTQKRTHRISYGTSISVEKDFTSFGLNTNYAQDNSSRVTTYNAGVALTFDEVRRSTGGTPLPLSEVGDGIVLEDGSRVTLDLITGLTRVFNRRTLGQLNLSTGYTEGYLTDPYKLVSRTFINTSGNYAETATYYENRPSERQRSSIYGGLVHQTRNNNVMHASYRYYWDDWDIKSHTLDYRLKFRFNDGHFIEPHLRVYNQTAANFHLFSIDEAEWGTASVGNVPEYASADYRLDQMNGTTIGLNYGKDFYGHGRLRIRYEYIKWEYENSVFPENKASAIQVSYQKYFE